MSNPPVFTLDDTGNRGLARRKCTRDYKIRPVARRLRDLGYGPSRPVRHALAISYDELERMSAPKDTPAWMELAWPLVDAKITRADCLAWIERHGYPDPPKSACVFCPYHSDAYWRRMREERPDEWRLALEVDGLVRHLPGMEGEGFLHRDRIPLGDVVLALEDVGQLVLLDREDGEAECGGGCFL